MKAAKAITFKNGGRLSKSSVPPVASRCFASARVRTNVTRSDRYRSNDGRGGLGLGEVCRERFPYRLQLLGGDKQWIVLLTQDRQPAARRHIFCLREDEPPSPDKVIEELGQVAIVAFHERGRRTSVVLDRKRYKRCNFLFLANEVYKGSPEESYEHIFWLIQRSIEQRRPAYKFVSRSSWTQRLEIDPPNG